MKTLADLPFTPEQHARLRAHAVTALPLAYGSLTQAFVHACASLSPHALALAQACSEQAALLPGIRAAGLIPYHADEQAARAYLDAHIEQMPRPHPLLARYAELHAMRLQFLPARH